MSDTALRSGLIRLASSLPAGSSDRRALLQVLAGSEKLAHGPVALKSPAVMLYFIDPENNNSKFYEMAIEGGPGGVVLQKRWGRLTDRGGVTGRVDSKDESFPSMLGAERAMMAWKQVKMQKGYQDVSRTRDYPIGLGGAGFGWGGQVACQYIPELQALKKELEQQMSVLGDMRSTVDTLARKDSSMGRKLQAMVDTLAADLKQINAYLNQQLSECG